MDSSSSSLPAAIGPQGEGEEEGEGEGEAREEFGGKLNCLVLGVHTCPSNRSALPLGELGTRRGGGGGVNHPIKLLLGFRP
jgi:hypothetical protein